VTASQYELLKCNDCGKILGYIYTNVKIFSPERLIRLSSGGPLKKIEKSFVKSVSEREQLKARASNHVKQKKKDIKDLLCSDSKFYARRRFLKQQMMLQT
jgi:hypothetical protein